MFLFIFQLLNLQIFIFKKKTVMEALRTNAKREPCAVCITEDKKCKKNCEFAAYFPTQTYLVSYIFINILFC